MAVSDKFLYWNARKTLKIAVHEVLSDKLPESTASELSRRIWASHNERSPDIEKREMFGATVMVKLSLLTLIIYEIISEENFGRKEAIDLTAKIVSIIYEEVTDRFWFFTRLFSGVPIKRVRAAMTFFIKCFPYRSPGYEMELLQTKDTEVAFNVHKCPAAEFFRERQLADLCTESWCNQDYPLAAKWNVELQRDQTLAKGNEYCNFKFLAKNAPR